MDIGKYVCVFEIGVILKHDHSVFGLRQKGKLLQIFSKTNYSLMQLMYLKVSFTF